MDTHSMLTPLDEMIDQLKTINALFEQVESKKDDDADDEPLEINLGKIMNTDKLGSQCHSLLEPVQEFAEWANNLGGERYSVIAIGKNEIAYEMGFRFVALSKSKLTEYSNRNVRKSKF